MPEGRSQRKRVAVCQPEFLEDLQHWIETDRRTARRLLELMKAVLRDRFGNHNSRRGGVFLRAEYS